MNTNRKPPCTCLRCGQPTDAPLCERCEAQAHELTVQTLDTLYAEHQRPAAHRAQRNSR